MTSSPGKHDGLYWEGSPGGLVSKAFAQAADSRQTPYYGYHFRILESQGVDAPGGAVNYVVGGRMIGGFALIAWPAQYGVSGIQTFIVSHDGIVFQKDLGTRTSTLASQMPRFDPDITWNRVVD